MTDHTLGSLVVHNGRIYRVLTVTDLHYGLVDPRRPALVDDTNGQQVAHIAARKTDVTTPRYGAEIPAPRILGYRCPSCGVGIGPHDPVRPITNAPGNWVCAYHAPETVDDAEPPAPVVAVVDDDPWAGGAA